MQSEAFRKNPSGIDADPAEYVENIAAHETIAHERSRASWRWWASRQRSGSKSQ
jgi:hypothetical protein